MIIGIIAALALQAAAPAQGDAKAPPAKSDQAAAKPKADQPDPDKKICRRQTPVGSNIEQRICKTQAQWDAEAQDAQDLLERRLYRNEH